MNPVLIFIGTGYLYFVALALLSLAVVLGWFGKWRFAVSAIIFSLPAMIFSATPYNFSFYLFVLLLAAATILPVKNAIYKIGVTVLASVMILALGFMELKYWFSPEPVKCSGKIYIVADSISAGIGFSGEKTYSELIGPPLVNRALGGGTVSSATATLDHIKSGLDDILLLEIGGNDLLRRSSAAKFREDLDILLKKASNSGSKLVMFELPLPPFLQGYGRAQRELSAQYGVVLIPKRYFGKILSGTDSTVDGLHLSNYGHEKMATVVRKFLSLEN